jgi:LysM repeat protein
MPRLSRLFFLIVASLIGVTLLLQAPSALLAAPAAQADSPTGDPVIVAAGDISDCGNVEDYMTAVLLDSIPGTVLAIGDTAYGSASLQEFNDCYGPSWGRHKDRTRPIPGNHEYASPGANGYFTYFGNAATPLEPGCTRDCKGYYSFDLGAWHIVALNTEIPNQAGSEQEQWLRADLAANPRTCTLAYWHRPRFSSVRPANVAAHDLFQVLYEYGADVLLSGHDHAYERFAPQDPGGQIAPTRGVRQFIVGTGGSILKDFGFIQPGSEARNSETFGVLKMTLHPTGYDWQFIPIEGQSFTDSGSASCVVAENTPAAPALVSTTVAPIAVAPIAVAPTAVTTSPAPAATTALQPAIGATYTVRSGDTLGTIAAGYGLTWQVLAEANGLGAYSIIEIGQVLRVPGVQASNSAPAVTSTAAAAPAVTTTSSIAAVTVSKASVTTVAAQASTASGPRYVVQPGDTLFAIALRRGVTLQALLTANGISETDILRIGQELVVPGQPSGQATAATNTTTTTGATPPAAFGSPTGRTYTVVNGDTIISIALAQGIDWQKLLSLNGLTATSILPVGQKLRLE